METKIRIIATVLILLVTIDGFSQRRTRPQPHFDELRYLVCTCGNKLVKNELVKEKHDPNAKPADVYPKYEFEKCSKCGIIWIWHCRTPRQDYFTEKPTDNKDRLIHKAVKDSCYSVEYFQVPSQGLCECTIKLKLCDQPLYCTVEGETGVYIVTKGHSESYLEKNGKKKKVFVTHEKPEGFTPVRGNNQ